MQLAARSPIVGEVVGGRTVEGDAGELGKVSASQVAGGVGVIDGKNAGIKREGGEVR